jgi:hypothetical protein
MLHSALGVKKLIREEQSEPMALMGEQVIS